jgi:hypothetical protein
MRWCTRWHIILLRYLSTWRIATHATDHTPKRSSHVPHSLLIACTAEPLLLLKIPLAAADSFQLALPILLALAHHLCAVLAVHFLAGLYLLPLLCALLRGLRFACLKGCEVSFSARVCGRQERVLQRDGRHFLRELRFGEFGLHGVGLARFVREHSGFVY